MQKFISAYKRYANLRKTYKRVSKGTKCTKTYKAILVTYKFSKVFSIYYKTYKRVSN